MKEDPTVVDTLFERVTQYTLTYIELVKLKTINRVTEVASAVFPDVIVLSMLFIFALFANLGLAFWLGDLFGKVYLGFLLVAGFYLILGCVSHFFMRGWFKKIAVNYFIKQLFR
jgi:hypothetical protein